MDVTKKLYTDGSCLGNPGPGGWGFVLLSPQEAIITESSGSEPQTTNNRMEMYALWQGLRAVLQHQIKDVEIVSDSRLVVNTLTKGWKRKANLDLWQELDNVTNELRRKGVRYDFKWTKAHVGTKWNEYVDDLAREKAESLKGVTEEPLPQSRSVTPQSSLELDFSGDQPSDESLRPLIKETEFFCRRCDKVTPGALEAKPQSGNIKVSCASCGSYIKFAAKK